MSTEPVRVVRLTSADIPLARQTFRMMGEVFEETPQSLSDGYLSRLLGRPDFWALAAVQGDVPIGGLTAHELLMTRDESSELFIYDLAVHPTHQRRGIGTSLVKFLRAEALAQGISVAFVPADADDLHALDFYRALGGDEAPVSIFSFS